MEEDITGRNYLNEKLSVNTNGGLLMLHYIVAGYSIDT
jgi:hypothetical protein